MGTFWRSDCTHLNLLLEVLIALLASPIVSHRAACASAAIHIFATMTDNAKPKDFPQVSCESNSVRLFTMIFMLKTESSFGSALFCHGSMEWHFLFLFWLDDL